MGAGAIPVVMRRLAMLAAVLAVAGCGSTSDATSRAKPTATPYTPPPAESAPEPPANSRTVRFRAGEALARLGAAGRLALHRAAIVSAPAARAAAKATLAERGVA